MNKTSGKKEVLIQRGDVFWVNLDPTLGTETKKMRPGVILSSNLFNKHLPRVLIVPITSNVEKLFPFEAPVVVVERKGKAMLDQVRAVDKVRLGNKICSLTTQEIRDIEQALKLVFELT